MTHPEAEPADAALIGSRSLTYPQSGPRFSLENTTSDQALEVFACILSRAAKDSEPEFEVVFHAVASEVR